MVNQMNAIETEVTEVPRSYTTDNPINTARVRLAEAKEANKQRTEQQRPEVSFQGNVVDDRQSRLFDRGKLLRHGEAELGDIAALLAYENNNLPEPLSPDELGQVLRWVKAEPRSGPPVHLGYYNHYPETFIRQARFLSRQERGDLITLLSEAWVHGGALPIEGLWRLVGATSEADFYLNALAQFLEHVEVDGKAYVVFAELAEKYAQALPTWLSKRVAARKSVESRKQQSVQ